MFGRKSDTQLEKDFMQKAAAAARMPGMDNKKKAQQAFDKLPKGSPFKKVKFEGLQSKNKKE